MITSFSIKGFKQFTNIRLDNLKPLTLIGGKNNTGKTTILEAFFMFYDRANPEVTMRHLSWRGVGSITLNSASLWSPIFNGYDMVNAIEMEVDENKTKEKLCIKHNKEFQKSMFGLTSPKGTSLKIDTSQQAIGAESLEFIYYINNKKVGEAHLTLEGARLGMHVKNISMPPSLKKSIYIASGAQRNPMEDAARFGELDIHGQTDNITEILKIIEPNLKSLTTIAKGDHAFIYGDIGLSRKIPVSHMGEGTAKLLSIILAIATNENGIVLIDEIENGWHYSLLPDILKAIHEVSKKYNCQIFATTHSYEIKQSLIQGLSSEAISNITYIRLDKEKGEIKPKIYESEMLVAALKRGWETR
ncbi:conserved hypothetical protein [Desulfamplus magnetovallimortis]|uniref:Uncharacterized protein n=1 Tax=Desulfamplus magnetovallimortis TaxID=1246637 RepID=A0A1W1HDB1_9BACT|nr:AAA family ATPase [Desulfamplus magnetovallimortis]SLM30426.1 conserved hypothetical protein [Desulfamplus magnetovallimortis]